MSDVTDTKRPAAGHPAATCPGKGADWSTMTAEELVAFRDAENRKRASALARVITGLPDRGATIQWREVALRGRGLRVRGVPAVARAWQRGRRPGRPAARASRARRRVRGHGGAERLGGTATSPRGCPPSSSRSSTASSGRRLRWRRPSTTAGTCCGTWCGTPRTGESIRRGPPSSVRAPARWSPPWPRSGPEICRSAPAGAGAWSTPLSI